MCPKGEKGNRGTAVSQGLQDGGGFNSGVCDESVGENLGGQGRGQREAECR